MPRTVKVAVIGSGLAGLTSAYLLNQKSHDEDVEFDVHIFEKVCGTILLAVPSLSRTFPQASILGMDASSVSLPVEEGEPEWRVDVPMRSFQGGESSWSSQTNPY
jgi:microfibrillar-associated protein 1